MSKKKKIILAVVIIVAIAAVSVGFFLKGEKQWRWRCSLCGVRTVFGKR